MKFTVPPDDERLFRLTDLLLPELIINHIFPFVGDNQYRFVGGVSRQFQKMYCTACPIIKATKYNLTHLKLAKICWDESPLKDRPILLRHAQNQSWYYYIRSDDPNHTDRALLQWGKETFACTWNLSNPPDMDDADGNTSPCIAVALDNDFTCLMAARNKDLEVLKWARANHCSWNEYICAEAASNGDLELLVWAHENGCPWNADTCTSAAQFGHLEVLQYAHINGCPWNASTCTQAARIGNLEILKYAHTNGCAWDKYTCQFAVENGHLEMLQYAHANGCPWDQYTCQSAVFSGHWELLEWAYANECPLDQYTYDRMIRHRATASNLAQEQN